MASKKSICEEQHYKTIFETHVEVIRNFIYYKCGDMQQAEDITQDAFIRLWHNCNNVVFEKAKSFVMKVAQNAFFNAVKHKKVMLKYEQDADISGIFSESPEFKMEEKEFLEKLQQCIANMAPKQREVFLLSRKDNKTYREIAEIVGIGQKAVERRMSLALTELREKLGMTIH